MAETYTNNGADTLNGAINNSVTSLIVHSASSFPSSNDFRILIDSELMLVTAVSGTTFTVTRGVEGTSAASHLDAAPVTEVLTAASLDRICHQNTSGYDVIGSRPTAGDAGRLFIPSGGILLERDDGSVWRSFGPLYKFNQPPAAASFTLNGQSGPSLADMGSSILVTAPYTTSESRTAFYRNQSSTWRVTMAVMYFIDGHNGGSTQEVGLGFIDASGHYSFLGFKTTGGSNNILNVWLDNNAHTSVSSSVSTAWVTNTGGVVAAVPMWFRIEYQTTNRVYYFSWDGINFQQAYSEPKNTTFTPTAAALIVQTKSGGAGNTNMGPNLLIQLLDWTETAWP